MRQAAIHRFPKLLIILIMLSFISKNAVAAGLKEKRIQELLCKATTDSLHSVLKKAKAYTRKVESKFGSCNYTYLKAQLLLVSILGRLEKFNEAFTMGKKIIEDSECGGNRENEIKSNALLQLGIMSKVQGRYNDAVRYFDKALNVIRGSASSDSIVTQIQIYEELSDIAYIEGVSKYEEKFYKRAIDLAGKYPDNEEVRNALLYFRVKFLINAGRYGEAEKELAYLGEGEGNRTCLERQNLSLLLPKILRMQGKAEEAVKTLYRIKKELIATTGGESCLLGDLYQELARCKSVLGQFSEASRLLDDSEKLAGKCYGKRHSKLAEIKIGKASILYQLGRTRESLEMLTQEEEEIAKSLGALHPLRLSVLENIANLERLYGNIPAAMKTLGKLLKIQKKVFGEKSRIVEDTLAKIRWCKNKLEEKQKR